MRWGERVLCSLCTARRQQVGVRAAREEDTRQVQGKQQTKQPQYQSFVCVQVCVPMGGGRLHVYHWRRKLRNCE